MLIRIAIPLALILWLYLAPGRIGAAEVLDKAPPADPSQVQLTGWLGQRVEANWKNRLAAVSLDERLRTFQNPSEAEGWSGEHIGKWLHAACLTWKNTHDAALRTRIEKATATLISCQAPDGYLGTYARDSAGPAGTSGPTSTT